MAKAVLIIGEDPELIDFDAAGAPEGMSAQKIMAGLEGAAERLRAGGHDANIPLTRGQDTVEEQVGEALAARRYDVIVAGAGLRTLPPMAAEFETLMNVVLRQAGYARLAFNSRPDDPDEPARRWLD